MEARGVIDRLAMRSRPDGQPIMRQRWKNLLFLHWPMDPAQLRPLLPSALELDLFEGKAWLGITPFHLEDVRPAMLPAFPGMSTFDELNMRTYVLHKGVPGIWFFSLDASKLMPAVGARIFFMLPYHKATIDFRVEGDRFEFQSRRSVSPEAAFHSIWRAGERLRDPDVHSLAFFLVERYCCFSVEGRGLYQTRIYHHPWILDEARIEQLESSMFSSLGLPEPAAEPLAHFSQKLEVEVWPPALVGETVPAPAPSFGQKIPIQ